MGVLSGYFSGYAQKCCTTSFDIESGSHDFTILSLTESAGYHSLSKIKDTVDTVGSNNSIMIDISIMTPWTIVKEKKMHWAVKTNSFVCSDTDAESGFGIRMGFADELEYNRKL